MSLSEKYDKLITGLISGFLLPVVTAVMIFAFAKDDPTLGLWIDRIVIAGIATNIVSVCVFTNVIIFLLFNHFDMLRASRGVLAVTVIWALFVLFVRIWL